MKRFWFLILFVSSVCSLSARSDSGAGESRGLNFPAITEPGYLELKVYPNPVIDKKFTVELSNLMLKEIRIINIAGKQVYEKKVTNPAFRFEVNVAELPDGIYFLKVQAEGNMSKTIKLMISSPR